MTAGQVAQSVARRLCLTYGWDGYAAAQAVKHVGRRGGVSPWFGEVHGAIAAEAAAGMRAAMDGAVAGLSPAIRQMIGDTAQAVSRAARQTRDSPAAAGPPGDREKEQQ